MTYYGGFAYLYDQFMNDIPYEAWASYIDGIILKYVKNRKDTIVLDMACGTGNITMPLARLGYDMIAIDISTDMLAQAQSKINKESILFLHQDMRQLDLYGTVDAVVCACDGFNYILDEKELAAIFKRVKMFLSPGGVFVFDMNTAYKFQTLLGNKIFSAETAGAEYEWQNSFNPDTGINEYQIVFMPKGRTPFVEVHKQRAYPTQVVCDLLYEAGFIAVETRDSYNDNSPMDESIRIVYIAT